MTDPRALRILVTNDDGIAAHGIKVLEAIARDISEDVWVVAPESNHSGAGHSLTLRRPLRVRGLDERHFAVDGTPTDCVLVGLQRLIPDKAVDLVLSGINHGGNLGEDVTYSGTIAAAMEATLFKVRSIALSQVCGDRSAIKWATAETFALPLIRRLVATPWAEDVLVNVNFPDRVAGACGAFGWPGKASASSATRSSSGTTREARPISGSAPSRSMPRSSREPIWRPSSRAMWRSRRSTST